MTRTWRHTESSYTLEEGVDKDIWMWGLPRSAQVALPAGFAYDSMSSHVLLAACRHDELAWEIAADGNVARGAFTSSLVQQLHEAEDLNQVTYSALLGSVTGLIHQHQHPHCEGKHKERALFSRTGGTHQTTFRLSDQLCVEAGSIHGVVKGTLFAIYPNDTIVTADKPLGILAADVVHDFSCELVRRSEDTEFDIPDDSNAVVLSWKCDEYILGVACTELVNNDIEHSKDGYSIVENIWKADLHVSRPGGTDLQLDRLDQLMAKYAQTLPVPRPRASISDILRGISHFNYHLYRQNKAKPLGQSVNATITRLEQTNPMQNGEEPIYAPDGKVMVPLDPENEVTVYIPCKSALVNLEYYGVTVHNLSGRELFPYLFYFDPSDYSIKASS